MTWRVPQRGRAAIRGGKVSGMNSKKYIFFDLDGTLTDPMIGITRSVRYALKSYGIEEPDLEKLTPFIGPPLKDSFMKYYDFSEEQATEAIGRYREYFAVTGIFENQVYDGITRMLKHLKDAGKILLVATSKPELFAQQILEHFRLRKYFTFVGGASMDEVRVKKEDVIAYVMESVNISDGKDGVMVGDREYDIIGGKKNGMESVGVLFGYGSRQELEAAGADEIANNVEELEQILSQ